MINPMGHDAATVWSGLKEGKSGVAKTTLFDASGFPTKISAEVKNWDITDCGEPAELWRDRGRHTKFAVGAAKQAIADSGVLDSITDPVRFGVYLGSGEGNQDFLTFSKMMAAALADGEYDASKFIAAGLELLDPAKELEQEPNMPAAHLATMFNAQGPNLNCLTACAASSQAVGEATEIIRRGDADVMLAGGTHSMIHPFGVTGFNLLTALSEKQRRTDQGKSPVRSPAKRICARRRIGDGDAGRTGIRQSSRCDDLWRSRRLRHDRRCLSNHRHSARRPRRHCRHADGDRRRRT